MSASQAGRPGGLSTGRLVADGRRECARVARQGARTFYVAFCLLPPRRRHAIHAVYAFSRAADDIADDPALPAAEKRRRLAELRDLDTMPLQHRAGHVAAAAPSVLGEVLPVVGELQAGAGARREPQP